MQSSPNYKKSNSVFRAGSFSQGKLTRLQVLMANIRIDFGYGEISIPSADGIYYFPKNGGVFYMRLPLRKG